MSNAVPADQVRLRQEAFYDQAEMRRFEWLTTHPGIQGAEQRLLGQLHGLENGMSVLEVGCGEGANLATLRALGARVRYTGFDCFPAKIGFCRQRHPDARFLVADARRQLPFRDGAFDRVLIRDILHHLAEADRAQVLRESLRVLRPGGRLWIVEGNARNLIGRAFAMIFEHERCMLETRVPRLQQLVRATLGGEAIAESMGEPTNFFRLLYHYQFGFPRLARFGPIAAVLSAWQALARWSRPSARWAYSIIEVQKTSTTAGSS
jgi:ubiquinone/menaquinone biosynthesis C-methylase UbiE